MAFYTKPTGTLKIRDGGNTAYYSVAGVNANLDSEETAEEQLNKIFYIAGLSVIADAHTKLTIEKGVSE